METDAGSEDEPPSLLWGLDPVFSAFARLYIKDILRMRESRQVPGTVDLIKTMHSIYVSSGCSDEVYRSKESVTEI